MNATLRIALLIGTSACALATGCARYEYDLVQPEDLAQHVGSKAPVRFPIDGLEYRLQTSNDRLVMMIYNRFDEPVKLLGDDSVVVDPRGESHPLKARTIQPDSFVKLILPPAPQQIRRSSPTFGLGMGVGFSRAHHGRRGFGYGGSMVDPGPHYYAVYDPNDATFWKWEGETDARLVLVFERAGGERFTDEFVFHRKKV